MVPMSVTSIAEVRAQAALLVEAAEDAAAEAIEAAQNKAKGEVAAAQAEVARLQEQLGVANSRP